MPANALVGAFTRGKADEGGQLLCRQGLDAVSLSRAEAGLREGCRWFALADVSLGSYKGPVSTYGFAALVLMAAACGETGRNFRDDGIGGQSGQPSVDAGGAAGSPAGQPGATTGGAENHGGMEGHSGEAVSDHAGESSGGGVSTSGSSSSGESGAAGSGGTGEPPSEPFACGAPLPPVTFPVVITSTAVPPQPAGGELTDGVYVLEQVTIYGTYSSVPGDVFELRGGYLHHQHTTFSKAGSGLAGYEEVGSYATTGGAMAIDLAACNIGKGFSLWKFTAMGDRVQLFTSESSTTWVQTFKRLP